MKHSLEGQQAEILVSRVMSNGGTGVSGGRRARSRASADDDQWGCCDARMRSKKRLADGFLFCLEEVQVY